MSRITAISVALFAAILMARESQAADEITIPNCTLLKIEGNVIGFVGPCDRPAALEVALKARITVNGKLAKLSDLQPGLCVNLTIREINKSLFVVAIEGSTE